MQISSVAQFHDNQHFFAGLECFVCFDNVLVIQGFEDFHFILELFYFFGCNEGQIDLFHGEIQLMLGGTI